MSGIFVLILALLAGVLTAIGAVAGDWSLGDGAVAVVLILVVVILVGLADAVVTWAGVALFERRHGARVEIHEDGEQRLLRRAAARPRHP